MNDSVQELTGISVQELESRLNQENQYKKEILESIVSLFDQLCNLVVYQKTNLNLLQRIQKGFNDIPESEKTKLLDPMTKYKNQVDLRAFKLWSSIENILDQIRFDGSISYDELDQVVNEVNRAKKYKQLVKQQLRNIS